MGHHLSRRELLRRAAVLGAVPSWLARLDDDADVRVAERCVVVVQLQGGNDGLNTIAPVGDDLYHRARPSLALAPSAGHALDEHHRWHPSLAHLARRFAVGEVAALQGVGYPKPNLSHFSSLDVWHSASLATPTPPTGWLGRLADATCGAEYPPLTLLALGHDVAPHALRAARGLAVAVPKLADAAIQSAPAGADSEEERARRAALSALERPGGTPAAARLAAGARAARQVALDLAQAADFEPRVAWPASDLARDLELVARVVDKGLPTRFFFVSQPGYDTHAIQGAPHAALLRDLDEALNAFLTELAARGLERRVLIMTMSDFGRRVRQNGFGERAGTDHGAASMQLLLGAGIEPGLYGPPPDLARLDEHGNLRCVTDFREVYAAVIERWLRAESAPILGGAFAAHPAVKA